jgi:YidC/Oxa1 family membrane protein insertase
MWLQFKLNPAPVDPSQEIVFKIMPWMMMFVMAPFAAGLLIYWITSNLLTIAQQKYLYMRHPQLRAQGDKDAADKARAAARDKSAASPAAAKAKLAPAPRTPRQGPGTPRKPKPRGR